LGENGAGKTTLLRLLSGEDVPDSGQVFVDGKALRPGEPREAARAGIALVRQEPRLSGGLSLLENIIVGEEPRRAGLFVDLRAARERAAALAGRFGLSLRLDARAEGASFAERQETELLRALFRGSRFLFLDEPTTHLSPAETATLFGNLRSLADSGLTVTVVTHRLEEVRALADRFVVLRHGAVALEAPSFDARVIEMAMFGHGQKDVSPRPAHGGMPSVAQRVQSPKGGLELRGLELSPRRRGFARLSLSASHLSLSVAPGEILAVVGLPGNGLAELEACLSGQARLRSGSLSVNGKEVGHSLRAWRRAGRFAYIPSDRLGYGLNPGASVTENLCALERKRLFRLIPGAARSRLNFSRARLAEAGLSVSPQGRAKNLSGGQAQRVVISRELGGSDRRLPPPEFILAADCQAGLDLEASAWVAGRLSQARESGIPIVMLCSDLDEALSLADRVVALYRWQVVYECAADGSTANRERLARALAKGSVS
jgi:simple sugar transport system ATP-binding protein